jgi:hypothetical protein
MTRALQRAFILIPALGGVLAGAALAQGAPIQFRLAAAAGNPVTCNNLDASLSRVHTVTLAGDTATIKSAGGIDDTMKQASPRVYKTSFSLGGVTLEVTADAASTPRSLNVVEPKLGCRWNAIAP